MPGLLFGDTVWFVLGSGTIDGQMFAQYAERANNVTTQQVSGQNPFNGNRSGAVPRRCRMEGRLDTIAIGTFEDDAQGSLPDCPGEMVKSPQN